MSDLDILKQEPNSPMEKAAALVELKAIQKQIKEKVEALTEDLLKATQALDVITLKTGTYTITRAKRITPVIENFDRLKKTLEDLGIPYGTKEVFADFMSETFKEAIKQGKRLDGLEAKETEYITIRINTK